MIPQGTRVRVIGVEPITGALATVVDAFDGEVTVELFGFEGERFTLTTYNVEVIG